MVGYRAAIPLLLAAVVVACASPPRPSEPRADVPSGSQQLNTESNAPSQVAQPEPMTVEEAGAALLAAEGRLTGAWDTVQGKYHRSASCAYTSRPCSKSEMKAGKEYWAQLAAAVRRYVRKLEAIRFPEVAASAAATHINSSADLSDRALSASKATTLDTFNARAAAAAVARDTFFDDVQPLKDALGLPVGP